MPGLVSIIDGSAGAYVRGAWATLSRELGLRPPPGAVPHLSYHVATTAYDEPALLEEMDRLGSAAEPLRVAMTGLAIFAGEPSVLYLAATRTPALSRLQHDAWYAAERCCDGSAAYWEQERWVPHVTLAMDGLTPALAARAVDLLVAGTPPMEAWIDNLALIDERLDERSGSHQLVRRVDFAARMVDEQ